MSSRFWSASILAVLLVPVAVRTIHAFDLNGRPWANGDIAMHLQLANLTPVLIDGAADFNASANIALEVWNEQMVRSRFVATLNSTAPVSRTNELNNVLFSSTIYGESFEATTLAVTLRRTRGVNTFEADVIFNTAKQWDSYRGNIRQRSGLPLYDLRRVAIHEFGHVLGLDHPDEAGQTVAAVMNSTISNLDTVTDDDIAGARELYGTNLAPPVITAPLQNVTVTAGQPLSLSVGASGTNLLYGWTFRRSGGPLSDLLDGDGFPWERAAYTLFSAQTSDAGTYSAAAANYAGFAASSSAVVTVLPATGTRETRLANIATRGRAGTGPDTFIAGFSINGHTPKRVLIRGIGPALVPLGVQNALADPKLELSLFGSSTLIAVNNDWGEIPADAAALAAAAEQFGAFKLPVGSKDAAMLVTLAPGTYSAQIDTQGGQPGIALVEVYDADINTAEALSRKLVNISTRGFAGVGEERLFAGINVTGPGPKQVLIRAVGPGLTQFGVTGVNSDPNLELFQGVTRIADNDDWDICNETDLLPAVFEKVGAFALEQESYTNSALLITLPPGSYSAQVSGRNGQSGVVLLEVYEVPE